MNPLSHTCTVLFCSLDAGETLGWGHRVPGFISTVIVDHVIYTNPFILSGFEWVKFLVSCSLPPVSGIRGTDSGSWHGASLNVKVLVVSIEGCFAPVNLLKPASCSPVVRFPQRGIDSHGLELREWDVFRFIVLVDPNGHIIHVEAANTNNNIKNFTATTSIFIKFVE